MIRAAALLLVALATGCGMPRPVAVDPDGGTPSSADDLRRRLHTIFTSERFDRGLWGVLVTSASSNETLYSLHAGTLMMPASTLKIVTAAVAAEQLGWSFRFDTRVVTEAPIESGVVRGDLIVIGSGDPSISERSDTPGALQGLAAQVKAAGVTSIEGAVIGDDNLYEEKETGNGWTIDNLPYGYSAPVSALTYNESSVDLLVQAGDEPLDPVTIEVRPEGSDLLLDNRLITAAQGTRAVLTLFRPPGALRLTLAGAIPAGSPSFVRTASVSNPTKFFAEAFRRALLAEGIHVGGPAMDVDELSYRPAGVPTLLAVHRSAPLAELIATMMHVSQNQYAELLLRALGTYDSHGGIAVHGAAADAALIRIRETLDRWGLPADSVVMADGSGLSRYNYVTAEALVAILQHAQGSPAHATAFSSALPIAGRTGTIARRLVDTPAAGLVRAKTGSVDHVRAMSGYVETVEGELLLFAIMANNFRTTEGLDAAIDDALVQLATFRRSARGAVE